MLMAVSVSLIASGDPIKVNAKKSTINWVGKKITGSHNGTIQVKSGELVFDGKVLTGGSFTVDMNSLQVTDLEAGKGKEKLEGHLNSDDFFGVATYPEASLRITDVVAKDKDGNYTVTGIFNIKGTDQEVTFDADVKNGRALATIKIDRTKHGIKYGSGSFFDNLGDKTINDEFTLEVNLVY